MNKMKKKFINLLLVIGILIIFSIPIFASETIDVKDYIKDKFTSIFSFYLSSLEELDQYEKEFIDLLEKLPEEEQEYYAKEVYKNGFSPELLKSIKEGKTIKVPTSKTVLPSLPKQKEESTENLPSLIKRIEPSTVIVFAYDDKGEFLCQGSGFFISQNGDIITNYHILERARSAEVKTTDGKIYSVPRIVAVDSQSDIVRISIDIASPYVYPLPLCTTLPEVGERVIVYGSPLGLEKTVSDGIVSAIREVPDYGEVIQITAPVSPGSSGSPVLNMKGEVIGVATLQIVEGQNLNFAIPSEKIVNLKSKEEKTIFTAIEVFWGESPVLVWQEDKEKKDSDYFLIALMDVLYFLSEKEYEKALPCLEIVIQSEPAFAYFGIGYCYGLLGNITKSIEAFEKADHIDNVCVDCNLVGWGYSMLSNYTKAIEAYKQAIYIDPEDARGYRNFGFTYNSLGLYKDALEAFKQAIRIDPNSAYSHYDLGIAYLAIGDRNSALNEYKILKELDIDKANELFDLIY